MKRRSLVGVLIVFSIAWVSFITLYIALDSQPGAATPQELRLEFTSAVNDRDPQKLGELIEYPRSNATEFSRAYLKALDESGVRSVTATLDLITDSRASLRLEGLTHANEPFSYSLALRKTEDNWIIVLTPPLE